MGFFASGHGGLSSKSDRGAPSVELLHRLECRACPLNNADVRSPKMEPTGSDTPIVYILGEAPGEQEDRQGKQFVGDSGELLRPWIPVKWLDYIRWNNVVRTRPPKNQTPDKTIVECCRPSIIRDLERTKPLAIFGFGNVPLNWATGQSGIYKWRGRRLPVQVGRHTCWYYPMLRPAGILRGFYKGFRRQGPYDIGSENHRAFIFDLERAFSEVEEADSASGIGYPVVHTREMAEKGVEWVTGKEKGDLQRVISFLKWAAQQPSVGIDYETTHLRPYHEDAKILTAAVGTDERSMAFPIEHEGSGWSSFDIFVLNDYWVEFLDDPHPIKRVHNLAFEMEWTAFFYGKERLRRSKWACSMAQAFTLDERVGDEKPGCFALAFLGLQHFGLNLKALSNVNRKKLADEPLVDVLKYNALDAKYHYLLGYCQDRLIHSAGLLDVYQMQLRRISTMVLAQLKGMPHDSQATKELDEKYVNIVANVLREIEEHPEVGEFKVRFGHEFRPSSNPDVVMMFRDVFGVKQSVGVGQSYGVDEEFLQGTGERLGELVIQFRKAAKQHSTYIEPLRSGSKRLVVYPDGYLHTQLNTTFAETGRLSSEDPNLQNWTKRDPVGKEVRKQIKPHGRNQVILAFDLGQIEARVIAMASRDPVFVKILWEDYDVHAEWTERIARRYPRWLDLKVNPVGSKQFKVKRNDIKNEWTFPLFFGASRRSVAGYLEIPEDILAPEYEEFWRVFGGVLAWQKRLVAGYEKNGYVECLTGRRRRAPLSQNQVFNSPIQGTAADIVIDAMNRLSETGEDRFQANLQIHDDLTFVECVDNIDSTAEFIIDCMLGVSYPFINVPITVEMSVGENWYAMKEVGVFHSHKWKK